MRRSSWALVLLILSLSHTTLEAQSGLVISGIVQDQTGAAFFEAQVDLLKNGTEAGTLKTDSSETFWFGGLQPGNYEIRTHKDGFIRRPHVDEMHH